MTDIQRPASLSEIKSSTPMQDVAISDRRKGWGKEEYFTELQALLMEMRKLGFVTSFFAAGAASHKDCSSEVITTTDEKLTVTSVSQESHEFSDEEIIEAWGLEHGTAETVNKEMRLSDWRSVQNHFDALTTLFSDISPAASVKMGGFSSSAHRDLLARADHARNTHHAKVTRIDPDDGFDVPGELEQAIKINKAIKAEVVA